ncbi:MAG TPA: hypothetical protein VD864_00195, partial [Nocardioides sp.]|nr:hypothetical protein [Nocardioides sp.]
GDPAPLDPLDPRRRFERVHPGLGARIEEACRQPLDVAGPALLDLAEELLAPGWDGFPHAGVEAARRRIAVLT